MKTYRLKRNEAPMRQKFLHKDSVESEIFFKDLAHFR